jgi:hypothetical protein
MASVTAGYIAGLLLVGLAVDGARAQGVGGSARLVLSLGAELEGLDESFGGESLTVFPSSTSPDITGGGAIDDQLSGLRYRDRETGLLGTLRLRGQTAYERPLHAYFDVDAKAGEGRFSVSADATAAGRTGAWAGLNVHNLLMFDREQDGAQSVQDLLYLRWRRALGEGPWYLALRSTLDLSRAEGAGGERDTLLTDWYEYLDYEKGGVRLELGRTGLSSTVVSAGAARKWTHASGVGDYQEYTLQAEQGRFWERGMLDCDLLLQHRAYEEDGASLPSFSELAFTSYWFGQSEPSSWRCRLMVTGTLYDVEAAQAPGDSLVDDLFSVFNDDKIQIDAELLWRTYLVGGLLSMTREGLVSACEVGLGPAFKLNRYRHAVGDGSGVGAHLECALRGALGGASWWWEASCEVGRHDYRNEGDGSSLSFGDLTLSLSQTDFTYLEASLILGAKLPHGVEIEGFFMLDQEWHTSPQDNARLLSFRVAVRRGFRLMGVD